MKRLSYEKQTNKLHDENREASSSKWWWALLLFSVVMLTVDKSNILKIKDQRLSSDYIFNIIGQLFIWFDFVFDFVFDYQLNWM